MTISGHAEGHDVAENFGFKRLSPDNWLNVDLAWGGVVMSTSDRDPSNAWVADLCGVQLRNNVPLPVRKLFEVARSSMAYSLMFYPLLTLGVEQLTRVMEAAASEKCRILGAPAGVVNFRRMIEWLVGKGALTASAESQWKLAVALRNDASHPSDQAIYSPGMALTQLNWTANLVNSLYA